MNFYLYSVAHCVSDICALLFKHLDALALIDPLALLLLQHLALLLLPGRALHRLEREKHNLFCLNLTSTVLHSGTSTSWYTVNIIEISDRILRGMDVEM